MQEEYNIDGMIAALAYPKSEDARKLLEAMREGLSMANNAHEQHSALTRLKSDIDTLWRRCKEIWDSVGDQENETVAQELSAFRLSGRMYGLRAHWSTDQTAIRHEDRGPLEIGPLSTRDMSTDTGSTLAASVGSSMAWVLPNLVIGTHSVYQTLVYAGAQVALPSYTLLNGQLVVDHYTLLTASHPIHGWMPTNVTGISPMVIPVFGATFFFAHALDSIHACIRNRCSTTAAIQNVVSGGIAGGLVGLLYYSSVCVIGTAYAPIVSGSLCVGWLLTSFYIRKKGTFSDLFAGTIANAAGIAAFIAFSSPWLSIFASVTGSFVSQNVLTWISTRWTSYLRSRLAVTARQVLGVNASVSRTGVESAYRNLARKHHPDKRGCREYFELIHVSKEILLLDLHEAPDTSVRYMDIARQIVASLTVPVMASSQVKKHKLELPADFLISPD